MQEAGVPVPVLPVVVGRRADHVRQINPVWPAQSALLPLVPTSNTPPRTCSAEHAPCGAALAACACGAVPSPCAPPAAAAPLSRKAARRALVCGRAGGRASTIVLTAGGRAGGRGGTRVLTPGGRARMGGAAAARAAARGRTSRSTRRAGPKLGTLPYVSTRGSHAGYSAVREYSGVPRWVLCRT